MSEALRSSDKTKVKTLEAFFDGACWPNPNGHAAAGALVKWGGIYMYEGCSYLGSDGTSNNTAEYAGLLLLLKYFGDVPYGEPITIYGDSNLVIQQMSGVWEIKAPTKKKPRYYYPFALQAKELSEKLGTISYKWVPREENSEADALSNKPLIDRGIRNPYK